MNYGGGVLFLSVEDKQVYVYLGKRTISPFRDYWSVSGGNLLEDRKDQDAWNCAVEETRRQLTVDVEELLAVGKARKLDQSVFKIPFIYRFETFVIALQSRAVLDELPHILKGFSEVGWFKLEQLPAQTHPGVHYALGVADAENLGSRVLFGDTPPEN
jgi:ADP-ribose pyrophosphatase YjhB (NUDIX family)